MSPLSNEDDISKRSRFELRTILRNVFHLPTKHKLLQDKEIPNTLVTITKTETINTHNQDICLFSDSPHYIVRVKLIYILL